MNSGISQKVVSFDFRTDSTNFKIKAILQIGFWLVIEILLKNILGNYTAYRQIVL